MAWRLFEASEGKLSEDVAEVLALRRRLPSSSSVIFQTTGAREGSPSQF
jgi:hypothetical protein